MRTLTGMYLEEQRRAKHLTLGQLATAVGYSNIEKGARRLRALEREGRTVEGLLEKIIDVLALDQAVVRTLVDEDRQRFEDDWNLWSSEPVRPQLRFRAMPAVWCRESLPENLSREEAVALGRMRAMERRLTYVLVWSRKAEVWCYPTGETYECLMNVGEVAGPLTRLGGHGNRGFIFG